MILLAFVSVFLMLLLLLPVHPKMVVSGLKNNVMVKILLVEDNEMVLRSLENLLSKEGFNVYSAHDGKEAQALIMLEDFGVVVTDLMLPHVTGIELIHYIRSNESKKHAKIIVVSSKASEESKKECYRLGIDEYLTKPIMPIELVMRIKKLLAHKVMHGRSY